MSEASVSGYKPDFLDGYLEEYYKHLYPSKLICKWLGYGESKIYFFVTYLDFSKF